MKRTCRVIVMLFAFVVIQSLHSAVLTIYNQSIRVIKVHPLWSNCSKKFKVLYPFQKRTFSSGFHEIWAIEWQEFLKEVHNGFDKFNYYKIIEKNKTPPYNSSFLGGLNIGALFKIKANGEYFYNFGIEGKGKGVLAVMQTGYEVIE